MNLKLETKNNISKTIERTLGIPYKEFEQLDFDEQRKLIEMHKDSQKGKNSDEVTVMIGSGENSIFIKAKKGTRVMIGSGENSCFIRAGISSEEARQELDDKTDHALYSKPKAFVKKPQRGIQNTSK